LDGKYKKKKKKKFILKMRIGEMRERWEMGVDQKWKKGGKNGRENIWDGKLMIQ